jgi:hypothetical protein
MKSFPKLTDLDKEIVKLDSVVRAAENWSPVYRTHNKSFQRLVKAESKLERMVLAYFRDLSKRTIDGLIWQSTPRRQFDDEFDVHIDVQAVSPDEEQTLLLQFVYDGIVETMLIGADAGTVLYDVPHTPSGLNTAVVNAARSHVAEVVKGINKTTQEKIRSSIAQAIDQGMNRQQTINLLKQTIRDPKRAELIARTESVNAYNTGILSYGQETGAYSKTWHSHAGTVDYCGDLDEHTVLINDEFPYGGGYAPPAHPNCRCGMVLNYDDHARPLTSNPDEMPKAKK